MIAKLTSLTSNCSLMPGQCKMMRSVFSGEMITEYELKFPRRTCSKSPSCPPYSFTTVPHSVRGRALAPALVAALRAEGRALEPERLYTIATTAQVARENPAQLGRVDSSRPAGAVRELAIADLRAHGCAQLHDERG